MKFSNPMIVVSNMEKSKKFYYEVLGLEVVVDFGANVTLTGGVLHYKQKILGYHLYANRMMKLLLVEMQQNYILRKMILTALFKSLTAYQILIMYILW
ncbi:catechol-2,3-dioxygenase [Clostridium beijerinckii]|nr:catechol-2,3-dioxygenase [Clostridium beijerinckii]NOV69178.1 catechol-2,3-dioxygenase [Clostridium beijerinckii]NOW32806.1 catechol-2,3-dioxygenase [Clostridium beijerinckii]NOW82361.1 catechol-2,3-dioxygenase [Clostridium beijerinckii]